MIRLLQISDTHLFADSKHELLGLKTQASFVAVVKKIKSESVSPDLIVLSGDLSQDASEESYKRLAKEIGKLKKPTYWAVGNHDDYRMMRKSFENTVCDPNKCIIVGKWQIIILNSQKSGEVEGHVSQKELDFLEKCLNDNNQHYAIVMMHHHPLLVGSAWVDKLCIDNPAELMDVVDRFAQVKAIAFGHVHQEFQSEHNGVKYFATPSTSVQFVSNQDEFGIDSAAPGFRWIELHDDGKVESHVVRADEFESRPDLKATGY